jgi:hypothetical protein
MAGNFFMDEDCLDFGIALMGGTTSRSNPQAGDFGSFEPLTLETKPLYDKFIEPLPYAVTSPVFFQDLYSCNWVTANRYKILDDHLCIVTHDFRERDIYALPPLGVLGDASFERAIEGVYSEFANEELPCVFRQVSGFFLPYFSALERYEAEIGYDVAWSDYIFTMDDFLSAINKKKSREVIRGFIRRFRPEIVEISSQDADKIACMTRKYFCAGRNCEDCWGCEAETARLLIGAYEEMELSGVIVESEGTAIGYEVVCRQKDTMLFISKKVRHGTRGLNEYLNSVTVELFGEGANYINYSEDMGNDGLRIYKRGMGRHVLSHRYSVKLSERA